VWLSAVGEYRRALTTAQDAVTLRRDLAAAEPARYTPDLANSLTNLGICLERLDRADAQLQARAEAVAWWARLAELRPDDYRETYQQDRAILTRETSSWTALRQTLMRRREQPDSKYGLCSRSFQRRRLAGHRTGPLPQRPRHWHDQQKALLLNFQWLDHIPEPQRRRLL